MPEEQHPLSQKEFESIYSKVPRLTVEIIVKHPKGELYLTKRAIEPCRGKWHLPGGTVRYGEPLLNAVKRVANRELNIQVLEAKNVGYIEYPSHYNNGLDSPVGIVFEITNFAGYLEPNEESKSGDWFKTLPDNMHEEQDNFLLYHGYLSV